MKFAYADPPYYGYAKYYKDDPRHAEVNCHVLFGFLCEHYDGWAMSASSSTLAYLLSVDTCPKDVRIAAWVKPWASFKPGVNPAYTWEPVLFYGAKKRPITQRTVKDHVIASATMKKGLVGAKPVKFCRWIIELLGYEEGDTLDDIFPGTGIFGQVVEQKKQQHQYQQLKML